MPDSILKENMPSLKRRVEACLAGKHQLFAGKTCVYGTDNFKANMSCRRTHLLAGGYIRSECVFPHFGALKCLAGRHLNVSCGKTRVYGTASSILDLNLPDS